MKVTMCIGLLLAILATTCLCRPAEAPGTARDPRQRPSSPARRDRPEATSREQKHLISRFLPHVFAELSDRKGSGDEGTQALHDQYYPDWLDFGRRSAELSGAA